MATGKLKRVGKKQARWGESCLLEVQDDVLAFDGVGPGDYLVVDRGAKLPIDDSMVVVSENNKKNNSKFGTVVNSAGRAKQPGRNELLLLRKMEHFGSKVRLQPGGSPRQIPYLNPESVPIWGTVVAVMRKFEAA